MLPTVNEVVSRFLFNSEVVPENFVSEEFTEQRSREHIDIDIEEFMEFGAGRFALGSEFALVKIIFNPYLMGEKKASGQLDSYLNSDGTAYEMTKAELALLFQVADYGIVVDNKEVADNIDDYAERTFIWGHTRFKLHDDVKFVLTLDGAAEIQNYSVVPRDLSDNFDFDGGDFITNQGNNLLEHGVDPLTCSPKFPSF